MILNTGDVPNLYPADEKAEIIEKMQVVARTQVSSLPLFQAAPGSVLLCRVARSRPHPSPCTTSSLRE